MAYETLIVTDRGPVRVILVNRPKSLNALNKGVLTELSRALDDVEKHPEVRAVVLTGCGDKAFVAGADISEMRSLSPVEAARFSGLGHAVMDRIEGLRVPVIAAVNGFALGGGLELALSCDFIYASDNARLGLVETNLGLVPGFGGVARLSRRVGVALAREMIFTAKQLKAEDALRVGLVNKMCEVGGVVDMAVKTGEQIAEKGPLAVQIVKRLITATQDVDQHLANTMEQQAFGLIFSTKDHEEGIAAFLEKRKPHYEGK